MQKDDLTRSKLRFHELNGSRIFIALVLVYYAAVAYFSTGYFHWDEHYQIVEFANYKLGKLDVANLAWEFKAGIRPTLQPWLCYYIIRFCHLFSIDNPFHLALILRLLTALFAVFSIHQFVKASQAHINKQWRGYFVLLSYLLWVLPAINVRFSSETWSGLFFLLALSVVQQGRYKDQLTEIAKIGFLLGISFLFRYQSALLGMGLLLWLILIDKLAVKNIVLLMLFGLCPIAVGFLLDCFFYEDVTFSIYNYFYVNIVEGVSSRFGTSPWYQYFSDIIHSFNIFGILTLIAFLTMLVKMYKNVAVWCILPFLIVHTIIPHKELRFLFPVVNLVPYILIMGWQIHSSLLLRRKIILYFSLGILIIINSLGLFANSFQGAGKNKISIPTHIDAHYRKQRVNLIVVDGSNPYHEWDHPKNSFYVHPEMYFSPIHSVWGSEVRKRVKVGYVNLLVVPEKEMTGPMTYKHLKEKKFYKVYQSINPIVRKINDLYDRSINSKTLYLFEYRGDDSNITQSNGP